MRCFSNSPTHKSPWSLKTSSALKFSTHVSTIPQTHLLVLLQREAFKASISKTLTATSRGPKRLMDEHSAGTAGGNQDKLDCTFDLGGFSGHSNIDCSAAICWCRRKSGIMG